MRPNTPAFKYFKWTSPKISKMKSRELANFKCENGFVENSLIDNSYNMFCEDGFYKQDGYNKSLQIVDLYCRSNYHKFTKAIPEPKIKSEVFKCDEKNWKVIDVSINKSHGKVSKLLYTVCLDKEEMRIKYSFEPRTNLSGIKINGSREDVWGLDFFGNTIFEKAALAEGFFKPIQQKRLTQEFYKTYNGSKLYPYEFHRGHLAPYADFEDPEEKKATCEYINAFPQWSNLNSFSWSKIERQTRMLIRNNRKDWEIYTGTYGTMKSDKGPLYASEVMDFKSRSRKRKVPIPILVWKLVWNTKDKKKSLVYVGINDPTFHPKRKDAESFFLCSPMVITDKKEGRIFFIGDEKKGYVYQCRVNEFLKKIKAAEKI